jgi:hypothetical protein
MILRDVNGRRRRSFPLLGNQADRAGGSVGTGIRMEPTIELAALLPVATIAGVGPHG